MVPVGRVGLATTAARGRCLLSIIAIHQMSGNYYELSVPQQEERQPKHEV